MAMEPLTETVDLDIDESNELAFKIKMEGAATSPAKVRLVCEGEDFSYMFNGYGTGEPEVVQFTLPRMTSKIQEGSYAARVEVLVENRYFAPLQFQINFKKTLTVVAESLVVAPKPVRSEIKVTATPIVVSKPVPAAAPVAQIKFEQKPTTSLSSTTLVQPKQPTKPAGALREAYLKKSVESTDQDLDEDTIMRVARDMLGRKSPLRR